MAGGKTLLAVLLIAPAPLASAPAGNVTARPEVRSPSPQLWSAGATRPSFDSTAARHRARQAQRRFERLRRRHLPTATPFSGPCDEVVGRFCFWHGEGREPPADRPAVVEAREELIRTLDSLAASTPGDGWVAGHRVRYLVEAGETARAERAARDCRSEAGGWCDALLGYALHAAEAFERADSAYRAALEAMPEEERCRWTDLSLLLEGSGRREYEALPCADRGDFEDAFWRLADPLWILPGNDRRTEHFSRHVMDRLQEEAESGYGVRWGSDLRELLLRYGWPAGFERIRRPGHLAAPGRPDIQAYDPPGMRRFLPRADWIAGPPAAAEWEIEPRQPRSMYAPAYAEEFLPLEHEVAVFRRGEGAIVLSTFDLAGSAGAPSRCESLTAGMAVTGTRADAELVRVVEDAAEERASLRVDVPADLARGRAGRVEVRTGSGASAPAEALVLSVEAFCAAEGVAARARGRLELPPRPVTGLDISDLLLLDVEAGPPPRSLEEAAPHARPTRVARPGERLRLYWELYRSDGSPRSGRIAVSVALAREGGGFVRRALEWIGVASDRPTGSALSWREAHPDDPVVSRSVTLSLPDLPPGEYRLELEVRVAGQEPLLRSRRLTVER